MKNNMEVIMLMPEQGQKNKQVIPAPGPGGGSGPGPQAPQVEKPNTEEILKRMRKVDPDQARRYRQRTGE
ncbi:ubiquitin-like protein UBact [Methylacidiphilum kamchatkense]|nr:ubiquitin-like protein UBact [Methylacidiphilum kamchatkense]